MEHNFEIYTDGSASNVHECAGAYCAIVVHNGRTLPPTVGVKVPAKIGGMEIQAVNAALELVHKTMESLSMLRDVKRVTVNIFTDSTYVVNCATGAMKRNANQAEWRRFDELARDLSPCIQHTNRNTIPQQAMCDHIAGQFRGAAESLLRNNSSSSSAPTSPRPPTAMAFGTQSPI